MDTEIVPAAMSTSTVWSEPFASVIASTDLNAIAATAVRTGFELCSVAVTLTTPAAFNVTLTEQLPVAAPVVQFAAERVPWSTTKSTCCCAVGTAPSWFTVTWSATCVPTAAVAGGAGANATDMIG